MDDNDIMFFLLFGVSLFSLEFCIGFIVKGIKEYIQKESGAFLIAAGINCIFWILLLITKLVMEGVLD